MQILGLAFRRTPSAAFPRPLQVEIRDVYNEVAEILRKHLGAETFKVKPRTRNYAFEFADVPHQPHEYLKVLFSAK